MPLVKQQSQIETIKTLFVGIKDKTKLITEIANHETINTKFGTIRNTWFSNYRGWSIPEEHQPMVLKIIKQTINRQNNGNA
jgi:hypothetical protein